MSALTCLATISLLAQEDRSSISQHVIPLTIKGDAKALQDVMTHGGDPNSRHNNGTTALQIAVILGHADVAEVLLDAGATGINETFQTGKDRPKISPLINAAWTGDNKMVQTLLKHRADVSTVDSEGFDALAGGIAKGSIEIVQMLLESGANPNGRYKDGTCAVTRAAIHGRANILNLLLDQKGNLEFRDNQGNTPLMFAVSMGREEATKILLERGARIYPVNAWHNNALGEAKKIKDEDLKNRMVNLLRAHGAKDGDPFRKIDLDFLKACYTGDLAKVKLLLKSGADIEARGKQSTELYLRDAVAASVGHIAVLQFLIENNINIHMEDGYNFTALHEAARDGRCEAIKILVEHGLDPNAKSKSGFLPLFMAINGGRHPDAAAVLLKLGANPNARAITGESMLGYANTKNYTRIAKLLKEAGGTE